MVFDALAIRIAIDAFSTRSRILSDCPLAPDEEQQEVVVPNEFDVSFNESIPSPSVTHCFNVCIRLGIICRQKRRLS